VPGRLSRNRDRNEVAAFCAFISPWFVGFVLFAALPLLVSLVMSFSSFDLYGLKNFHWIGLANYRFALENPDTRDALRDTAIFTAIFVPLGLVVQIGLAVLVNGGARVRSLFSAVFYLPAVIPTVVSILLIWRLGIAGPDGVFDRVYHVFEPHTSVAWLDRHGRLILILYMLWSTAGLGMLVFLAGLRTVSRELQEAASLDGATRGQILRTITLPLLTPVIFLQVILALIAAAQMMIQPILLGSTIGSAGSPFFYTPARGADILPAHIFHVTFVDASPGTGAALSWLLFVILLAVTLILFATSRFWVFYGSGDETRRVRRPRRTHA
jgi:multiple sugar transport system permease protein